jgi:hypothetical protein
MNRLIAWTGVVISILIPAVTLAAPPKVVKAVPDNGAEQVDAAITELRVIFDQPMSTKGWSVVGGGDAFPMTGRPHWIGDDTIVLPITLKPGHEYALSINSESFQNFRNAQGEAAVPYPIHFVTASVAPPLTPAANDAAIAKLREALANDYAYLDVHRVDWDAAFAEATPKLEHAKMARQFAIAAGKLLAKANDMHIWLKVGETTVPAAIRRVDPNCGIPALMQLVPNFAAKSSIVMTGQFDDGIGYVMIREFSGDASALAPAMDALTRAKAVIVDVRTNSGGDELLAQQVAGCFVSSPQVYARDVIRQDGKDSEPLDRVLPPNAQHPMFGGKVAVLIGPENMSSCESFIEMMKTSPNCTTIGGKTWGSSGRPVPHDLGNGVTVMLPSWRDLRVDGSCIEGVGLTPDVAVEYTSGGGDDAVLDKALALLRGGN